MTIYPIHYSENKAIWISVSDFKTNQLENGIAMAAPGIHHPGITDLGAARHTDLHKEALKGTTVQKTLQLLLWLGIQDFLVLRIQILSLDKFYLKIRMFEGKDSAEPKHHFGGNSQPEFQSPMADRNEVHSTEAPEDWLCPIGQGTHVKVRPAM